ncbi:MAG: hypothetical protein KBE65_09960 [Phycisphaerae bacterium]|nr:hypothetical protein [Phycisphaerae bacterium]
MGTPGKVVFLLTVVGLCLPSGAEILVYKMTWTTTEYGYDLYEGDWWADKFTHRAYAVMDVDYDDGSILQARTLEYLVEAGSKWYGESMWDFEVTRIQDGSRTGWVVTEKYDYDWDDGEDTSFLMVTGLARARNIGTGINSEVAATLTGYGLEDWGGGGDWRYLETVKYTLKFYSKWTTWANGDEVGEGNRDFDATMEMIVDYLTRKGYRDYWAEDEAYGESSDGTQVFMQAFPENGGMPRRHLLVPHKR